MQYLVAAHLVQDFDVGSVQEVHILLVQGCIRNLECFSEGMTWRSGLVFESVVCEYMYKSKRYR